MKCRTIIWLFVLTLALAACGSDGGTGEPSAATENTPTGSAETIGRGMGPGSGMMARHHVTVPEPYAGMNSPVTADQASLDRGAELYSTLCASCHGDGGMGDGPAGATLDPAPAPVSHSSQMLGDDLLFWRISEGGMLAPFNSSMPAWKESLDEQARWDLINYLRALGRGQVTPRSSAGGAAYDPAVEQAERAEMLAQGVDQGVITQTEAELFKEIHAAMDEQAAGGEALRTGGMDQMRDLLLAELVEQETITQEQADIFNDVHERLVDAGLMQ